MAISSKLVETLVRETRVAVKNALAHNEIKEKISPFGYDDARLQEGLALCSRTDQKYQEQQHKQGEKIMASKKLYAKLRKERKLYIHYRQLARLNFKREEEDGIRKNLGIDGIARDNLDGVLKEARQLYEGILANDNVMAKMSRFALNQERLQGMLAELDELKRLDEEQESKKGIAQQATAERDDLYDELKLWSSEFVRCCKLAMSDDDQQLEKLGIPALSEGYKRRKRKKRGEGEEETEETEETGNSMTGEPS